MKTCDVPYMFLTSPTSEREMRRLFFVQPYRTKHHRLVASGALTFEDRQDAIAAGLHAARFRPGVVVLAQDVDARSGRLGKPDILAIHGRVPDAWHTVDHRRDAA